MSRLRTYAGNTWQRSLRLALLKRPLASPACVLPGGCFSIPPKHSGDNKYYKSGLPCESSHDQGKTRGTTVVLCVLS
jgi:hypothetical protein